MQAAPTGGCLCGAVRYRLIEAPREALYCHCRMCQRAHGAPVVAWLSVPIAAFAVTKGEPAAYRSSAEAFRHFCANCGTPSTWRAADDPSDVDVSIASLDDPAGVVPQLHLWTESRLPWLELADPLPRDPRNERPRPPR